jgi:glycosyltransferase involved in cell wall biosynthesis
LKILFLEPFYGGSHKSFADGLIKYSKHSYDLLTLPARFWKWRMRGAALYFVRKITDLNSYDLILTTDLMSFSDLKGLLSPHCPKTLVYFHENQLSYPLPEGESIDYQFGFTDITTALCADRVIFNSNFHKNAFLNQLGPFIGMMPEKRPGWIQGKIQAKTEVIYPGCDFPVAIEESNNRDPSQKGGISGDPLIIWNHRWEFDKNPEPFFNSLYLLKEKGLSFKVALLGENFQAVPKAFIDAKEILGKDIVQYGYAESRNAYIDWLSRGNIIISTAIQENFGISVVEAVRYGCYPILPNRLVYPELLPPELHDECLYNSDAELEKKLEDQVKLGMVNASSALTTYYAQFSWERQAALFDTLFEQVYEEP